MTLVFPSSVDDGFCLFTTLPMFVIAIPLFYQASCFGMVETVKLVNSMSTGPLLHFTCYELSSLMGRNAMSSASPWMVVLADALCAGEANPYPELSVYSSKKETLPFLLRKCSSVVATCHQVAGWSPWGVCPYQGLWWSLPLADLVTQIGLDVRFWV